MKNIELKKRHQSDGDLGRKSEMNKGKGWGGGGESLFPVQGSHLIAGRTGNTGPARGR